MSIKEIRKITPDGKYKEALLDNGDHVYMYSKALPKSSAETFVRNQNAKYPYMNYRTYPSGETNRSGESLYYIIYDIVSVTGTVGERQGNKFIELDE